MRQLSTALCVAVGLGSGLWSGPIVAQDAERQVAQGQAVYARRCARCHGARGEGKMGPSLIGAEHHLSGYGTADVLFDYTRQVMPADRPGRMLEVEYWAVLATSSTRTDCSRRAPSWGAKRHAGRARSVSDELARREPTGRVVDRPSAMDDSMDVVLAEKLKALAHPARLAILRTLAKRGRCVCGEVVEVMPLAQATVSQHLKILKEAGLIHGEIEGRNSCYCLDPDAIAELQATLDRLLGEPRSARESERIEEEAT